MVLEVTASSAGSAATTTGARANSCDTAGATTIASGSGATVPGRGADTGRADAGAERTTGCTGSNGGTTACAGGNGAEAHSCGGGRETAFACCNACLAGTSCPASGSRIADEASLTGELCLTSRVGRTGEACLTGEVRRTGEACLADEACFTGDACLKGEACLVGEFCCNGEARLASANLTGELPFGDAGFPADDHECAEVPEGGGAEGCSRAGAAGRGKGTTVGEPRDDGLEGSARATAGAAFGDVAAHSDGLGGGGGGGGLRSGTRRGGGALAFGRVAADFRLRFVLLGADEAEAVPEAELDERDAARPTLRSRSAGVPCSGRSWDACDLERRRFHFSGSSVLGGATHLPSSLLPRLIRLRLGEWELLRQLLRFSGTIRSTGG